MRGLIGKKWRLALRVIVWLLKLIIRLIKWLMPKR